MTGRFSLLIISPPLCDVNGVLRLTLVKIIFVGSPFKKQHT
jgi:hypothetical protein